MLGSWACEEGEEANMKAAISPIPAFSGSSSGQSEARTLAGSQETWI